MQRPSRRLAFSLWSLLASLLLATIAVAQLPLPGVPGAALPVSPGGPVGGTIPLPPELQATAAPALPTMPAPAMAPSATLPVVEAPPFGAKLFMGNFLGAREDGLNPEYLIMPGDHVQLNVWRPVPINAVLVVDGQGNVFLPEVGPIPLVGVRNADLTERVRLSLERVYRSGNVEVYTNLITAKPVAVFVTGGVNRPGRYAGVPSDSVFFFLEQAGGIHPALGSYRDIAVLRGGQAIAEIDLYEFLLEGKTWPVQFKDGDAVLVRPRGPVVELTGEIAEPSLVEFRPGKQLGSDALAVVPRLSLATEVTVSGVRSERPISRTFLVKDFASFPLADGDRIEFRAEGQTDAILVRLEGAYAGSSTLAVRRGSRLVDVLNYVPVDPTLADTRSIHIRRASVALAQKESIDDSLFRLERSALLALSGSDGESNIRTQEAALVQKFVERARLIQPLGRVVTKRGEHQANLVLQEGDVIVIPERTNVVRVGGEVLVASALMYDPEASASDYVERAGGFTERADEGRLIINRASAQVIIADDSTQVYPGDEILVAPEIDTKVIQNIGDVSEVVYQIAVAAAVVVLVL
jgi:protein involved in polysaccharide export with SLBB domain